MKQLTEEILNAYTDGALGADMRAEVEAHLETDAAARDLLEKLRRANALAMQAFEGPIHEPSPQTLIDTILKGPSLKGPSGQAGPNQVIPLGTRGVRARSIRDYVLPMAATFALAVGIAAGFLFGRQSHEGPDGLTLGLVPSESQLHRLLESTPSGRIVEFGGRRGSLRRHTVVATFRDRHARACREVEVFAPAIGQQPLAAGVACRLAGGGWVVEGAVRLALAPAAGGQHFEPSGVSERDALEGLLAMLGARTALPPEEEQALMQQGWK